MCLLDERSNSPLRHNILTGGHARDYMRTKGFERPPVYSAFHQFSMKRVLADPSMDSTHDPRLTVVELLDIDFRTRTETMSDSRKLRTMQDAKALLGRLRRRS